MGFKKGDFIAVAVSSEVIGKSNEGKRKLFYLNRLGIHEVNYLEPFGRSELMDIRVDSPYYYNTGWFVKIDRKYKDFKKGDKVVYTGGYGAEWRDLSQPKRDVLTNQKVFTVQNITWLGNFDFGLDGKYAYLTWNPQHFCKVVEDDDVEVTLTLDQLFEPVTMTNTNVGDKVILLPPKGKRFERFSSFGQKTEDFAFGINEYMADHFHVGDVFTVRSLESKSARMEGLIDVGIREDDGDCHWDNRWLRKLPKDDYTLDVKFNIKGNATECELGDLTGKVTKHEKDSDNFGVALVTSILKAMNYDESVISDAYKLLTKGLSSKAIRKEVAADIKKELREVESTISDMVYKIS